MKRVICLFFLMIPFLQFYLSATSVLVETESFEKKGGWVVDQQFIHTMGSPYLLAHGMGEPVENASTTVKFPAKGNYHFWVRTKNWISDSKYAPGIFMFIINGKDQNKVFGNNGSEWQWVYGGKVYLKECLVKLELKDLTGFEGRCDAIYFSTDNKDSPPEKLEQMTLWRYCRYKESSAIVNF